jgi:hypothetical protein
MTFNRNYAARMHGSYAEARWVTNTISQTIQASIGDSLSLLGFVHWPTHDTQSALATADVSMALSGPFATDAVSWSQATSGWHIVELLGSIVGVRNQSFEDGTTNHWYGDTTNIVISVQTNVVADGNYALRFQGSWTGWAWNEMNQSIALKSGEVVVCEGSMNISNFTKSSGWAVAGIKLELDDSDYEQSFNASVSNTGWTNLHMTVAITNTGIYTYRFMVCGDVGSGIATSLVYFDNLRIWRQGEPEATNDTNNVTVTLTYEGYSGGANTTNDVDLYVDDVVIRGSSVGLVPPTDIFMAIGAEARAIATNPAVDVPELTYPTLYAEGYPEGEWWQTNFGTHAEVMIPGWKFQYMTNNAVRTATNVITVSQLGTQAGYIEIDQYRYVGKMPHKERGAPVEVDTNSPYWTLGNRDGSSVEFGSGPFPATHRYVVGTSLTNLPRFMTTTGVGWPSRLEIVFNENFSTNQFDNSLWNKHFALTIVPTNGALSRVKALKFGLYASNDGTSNTVKHLSHEIHMGWAAPTQMYGKVDYPNCTYQDHNEVSLRAPWLYNLLDDGTGWFMQQRPRGSATIEPIDLFVYDQGSWVPQVYEEYLFGWDAAGSGVASLWDHDEIDRVPGNVSYHIGFKVGHQYGTNALGQPMYPEVINIRGNGYFRMTDYDGIMAGSFRPVAADVFGLYQLKEDAPLMPEAYVRVVPRQTPAPGIDDSYAQAFLSARSKTNNWFTSSLKVDMHFSPDEVANEGCYFDLEADTYCNKAVIFTNHGPLSAFAQVSMHWRGGNPNREETDFSDLGVGLTYEHETEDHDIDAVVLKRADGEWITHQVINPPTNVYHRVLGDFQSNDVVYLMQQDRQEQSYAHKTEQPYRKASAFEISMLNDGGRDLTLDVYEQYTFSEIADNVDIVANFNEDFAQGEKVHYKYRYRTIYAPGVYIVNPNHADGNENWISNNLYKIEFLATDGHYKPLEADIYYGNGLDSDWTKINTGGAIDVDTNTHREAYVWDTSSVDPGAYYIKVTAVRKEGGKTGFDVSNTRLYVADDTYGFARNGGTNVTVVTNTTADLGGDMGFESGSLEAPVQEYWSTGLDDLGAGVSDLRAYDGDYSARLRGDGWHTNGGLNMWSFNNIYQPIQCASGDTVYVTGRVYIASLKQHATATNWLRCGIKFEAPGGDDTEQYVDMTSSTGVWHNLSFTRTFTSSSGVENLRLFVMGYDCTGADVFFDKVQVASTNTGTIVTNNTRTSYWVYDSPVDVSGHNLLTLRASGTSGVDDPELWVADTSGVTNTVKITNFVERLYAFPRRVELLWTNFTSVDQTALASIGFKAAAANDLELSRVRSLTAPMLVSSRVADSPQVDLEGMPLFNPGETVTNIVTIRNNSGSNITNVTLQLVQEYGETAYWWDTTSHEKPPMLSAKARPGDRLCGGFEEVYTNVDIAAGGTRILTNIYHLPYGRRITATQHVGQTDWHFDRNYDVHAQVRLVTRETGGDTLYAVDQAGFYNIDEDFDIDNDGLSDAYEIRHSTNHVYNGLHPERDADGDGVDNLGEFIAGTVPTNAASFPSVYSLAYSNGVPLEIFFDTVTGRVYWVEWRSNMVEGAWQLMDTRMPGSNAMAVIEDDVVTNEAIRVRYYKLGVEFQDSAWPP